MEPKTEQRRINYLKANKKMVRRELDIPEDKISFRYPEILTQFTSDSGKILPRRITGIKAYLHRKITKEIKRSRALNLLP